MSQDKHFQGKCAFALLETGKYLSGSESVIAATATSVTSTETFILYSPEGSGGFATGPTGVIQLQSNMKYLSIGTCGVPGARSYPACMIVAAAIDADSAAQINYDNSEIQDFRHIVLNDVPIQMGIVWQEGIDGYLGYYGGEYPPSYGGTNGTLITPSLDSIVAGESSGAGCDFSWVDLTEENLSGLDLHGASFANAVLAGTNFKGAILSGCDFTNCDLTTVVFDDTTVVLSSQSQPVSFNGATLPFSFIGFGWEGVDFRNATVPDLPLVLSSADNPLQAAWVKLSGLNQNNLSGYSLANAVLDNALLDNLVLSYADLSYASMLLTSLHGTDLSYANLEGANLTGAQIGAIAQEFPLDPSYLPDLNNANVPSLQSVFAENGITLSQTAFLKVLVPGQVWSLNDAGNSITYSIRLDIQTNKINVYAPVTAGTLAYAYMPNAVLTGANLYGVSASYCQFYGDTARIDGSAILEEAQLNDANLSGVDFSQAQLMGANLSGAQLFNASFNAARLGPSANGGNANLTGANLQGADFTDAELYSATLAGAAVAITIPTQNVPQQGAVYLFSLPRTRDGTTLQQYLTEIEAASNWFSLNPDGDTPTLQKYVTALQENDLGVLEVPFQGQKPPISLSSSAKITSVQNGVWQIIDGTNSYTLFESTDVNGNTELYASTSLVLTQAAFKTAEMALRPQTFVTTDTPEQQWLLDNDSEDPQNTDLGYVEFLLHLNGDMLDVYGIAIHVQRLADDNTLQIETESCNLTTLGAENMNGATVCPNGIPLSVNQTNGNGTWSDEWLRTAAPPKPPQCVPTNNSWCPPPTVAGNAESANLPSTGV